MLKNRDRKSEEKKCPAYRLKSATRCCRAGDVFMPQLRDVDKRPCEEDRALVVSLSLTSWLWNSTRLPFTGCHPRALSVTFDDARGQEQHGGHGSAGSRTFRYGRQNLKSITHSITTPWHDRCLNGYSAWPHFLSSSSTERALNAILLTSGGVSASDNEITASAISGAHLSWKTLVLMLPDVLAG